TRGARSRVAVQIEWSEFVAKEGAVRTNAAVGDNLERLRSAGAAPEHFIQFVQKNADCVEFVRWNRTREGERETTAEIDACIPRVPRKAEHCQLIADYGQVFLSIRIVSATQVGKSGGEHCVLRVGG